MNRACVHGRRRTGWMRVYQDERDRPNALLARRYNHYLWVHGVGNFSRGCWFYLA
jgi:hypothetical protein